MAESACVGNVSYSAHLPILIKCSYINIQQLSSRVLGLMFSLYWSLNVMNSIAMNIIYYYMLCFHNHMAQRAFN